MTAWRAGRLAVAIVAVGVVLAVVLVTWAASIGSDDVLRPEQASVQQTSTAPPRSASPLPGETPPTFGDHPSTSERAVRVLLALMYVAFLVLTVALVIMSVLRGRRILQERAREPARVAPDDVPFDVLTPPEALGEELLADAAAQRAALTSGTPRNAIVECWRRFEVTAANVGVERHAWETPAEFTIRVLDGIVAADPDAVSRLAGLYREARFSEHELGEAHRTAALEALDTIHRTIRHTVGSGR